MDFLIFLKVFNQTIIDSVSSDADFDNAYKYMKSIIEYYSKKPL